MSYVVTVPEFVGSAVGDLTNLASSINAARAAAAGSTTGVLAAGADEVSAAIASVFSSHAHSFQSLSAQASAFHSQFV